MLPALYLCSKCGYAGRLVLEIDTEDLAPGGDKGGRSAE